MHELMPERVSKAALQGMQRMKHHQKNRAMFIKAYVGQYFYKAHGVTGKMPINLVYNAIRSIVPQYIMRNPVTAISSDITDYDDYAFLLGKALDQNNRRTKKKDTLRYGLVDSFFSMAIFKTAIADSGFIHSYGDKRLDNGVVFTDNVSLDDLVPDPDCKSFNQAAFIGDRVRVPRQVLLDDADFDHDLVMKIPRSSHPDAMDKVANLTKRGLTDNEIKQLEDHVDIIYLYVPDADAVLVIPDPNLAVFPDYLSVQDYYGPKDGPYTFLSLSQPVPDNPFSVAPVGIWYDLNEMANVMMVKTMQQAERQKDVLLYDAGSSDEIEDLRESEDGDAIAGDPSTAKVMSYGGQNNKSDEFVGTLRTWFNYMSGNPDQMAGLSQNAKTATQSQILASNASVNLEDGQGMVYDAASMISEKEAWFMHRDPFIQIPIPHRVAGGDKVQLILTPEQRRGEPEDFIFKVKAKSMQVKNPELLAKQILEFATTVVPGIMQAAAVALQMGQQFNPKKAIEDVAEQMGIFEEIQDWFDDPEFQAKMQLQQAMGPQGQMKAGVQQGGPGQAAQGQGRSPMQDRKASEQSTANAAQSAMKG